MGSLGEDLSLAPTLNRKETPKAFHLPTGPAPVSDGGSAAQPISPKLSPEVPHVVGYKTHQGIRRKPNQIPTMGTKAQECSFWTHWRGGRKQDRISLFWASLDSKPTSIEATLIDL